MAFVNNLDPGRLFGTLDYPNDYRDIVEMEQVFMSAQPCVFKTMVSAHLRHQNTPMDVYARSYQHISEIMVANAGDV